LHKSFYYDEYRLKAKEPAIKKRVASIDPQAAEVANYILMSFSRGEYEPLQLTVQNIVKFPQNQYFLYELALCVSCQLEEGLDSDILLKISNKLIELDGKNSNYYYLKAYALLHSRRDNNFDKVIDTVKQAMNCEYFKDPYVEYRDRAAALVQKQGLHYMLSDWLMYEDIASHFARDVYQELLSYYNFLVTENKFLKAQEISEILVSMITENSRLPSMGNVTSTPLRLYGIGAGFGNWNLPQEIELQRLDLTPAEADAKRMQICKIAYPQKTQKAIYKQTQMKEENSIYTIAAIPFMFIARLFFITACAAVVFFGISWFHKDNFKSRIGKVCVFLFLLYSVIYFVSGQFPLIYEIFDRSLLWHHSHSILDIFFMPPFLSQADFKDAKDLLEPVPFFLFVLPLCIVFVLGVLKFFVRKFDNLATRIFGGVLISMPLGLASVFMSGHSIIGFLPVIIFLLFAFKYSFRRILFRDIPKAVFGKSETDSLLRTNFLKLAMIVVVLCWIGILSLAVPVKKSLEKEDRDVKVAIFSFSNDSAKAYDEILKKTEDPNLPREGISRCIPLIQSKDLPEFMDKIKRRKFPSYNTPFGFPGQDRNKKEYENLNDRFLTFLLRSVSRDQMPVILKYLDNPDNEMALVFRAHLGDISVKEKLNNILNAMIANTNQAVAEQSSDYEEMKPRESQVVFALASISDSSEAFNIISEYYKRRSKNECISFYVDIICTLPKEVIFKLQHLYLEDLKEKNLSQNIQYYTPLTIVIGQSQDLYLDNDIAGKILSPFLSQMVIDKHLETYGIGYHLNLNNSDLLLKGLQSQTDELRAWSLAQLRRINYQFTPDQLQSLARDKSWKVRANLTLIDKSLIPETEPSPFVKLLKSF